MALGSAAAPPLASDEDIYTYWSLVISFYLCSIPCPCAWAHYGPWLFHAALAVNPPHNLSWSCPQPSQGQWIFLWSLLWSSGDLNCQIPSCLEWLSWHHSFADDGLLHTYASPKKQGIELPCSWKPPNQDELSVILTLGLVANNEGL